MHAQRDKGHRVVIPTLLCYNKVKRRELLKGGL